MKMFAIIALGVCLLASGCRNETATTTTGGTTAQSSGAITPEQLGELGAAIKKDPDNATKILSERGLTEAQFENEIRRVASDPDASKRYAAAFRNAGG